MEIFEVKERTVSLIAQLTKVWEESVKATHLFLSAREIAQIKEYVPEALQNVARLLIAIEDEVPVAFMGIEDDRLEMLFLAPMMRKKGLGRKLLTIGIEQYGVKRLVVNEQNPEARGFYEHLGFQVYKRSELDEQGQPYPILYMELQTDDR